MPTIIAYKTPPQQEFKAAREARDARIRAYVPIEKRSHKTATGKTVTRKVAAVPGYVFAASKPVEAKHIRDRVGACDRLEVRRLYQRGTSQPADTYTVGEQIEITKGHATTIPATVLAVCGGGWYEVGIMMMGKLCRVKMRLAPKQQIG